MTDKKYTHFLEPHDPESAQELSQLYTFVLETMNSAKPVPPLVYGWYLYDELLSGPEIDTHKLAEQAMKEIEEDELRREYE